MVKMSKELIVYAHGLIHCSICTNVKDLNEIEYMVNLKNPTGIESKWKISKDTFRDGTLNPCPCEQKLETHKHYLMVC